MLAELQAGEFIYEQPAAAGVEYVFKHALTQEVAYNSLLIERRKQLHERAGQALESMFAGQLDDHLTQLAHHYSHSDNIDKAIEYLGRAGQQAMQRSAHARCDQQSHCGDRSAAEATGQSRAHSARIAPQLALGSALSAIKGWAAPEVERAFTRAREFVSGWATGRNFSPSCLGCLPCITFEAKYEWPMSYARTASAGAKRERFDALAISAYALGSLVPHGRSCFLPENTKKRQSPSMILCAIGRSH